MQPITTGWSNDPYPIIESIRKLEQRIEQVDKWAIINESITREFFAFHWVRLPLAEFCDFMAREIENDPAMIEDAGGEWDFRPEPRIVGSRFRMEHPRRKFLLAVCRRELVGYDWEIFETAADGPVVLITGRRSPEPSREPAPLPY